MVIGDELFLGAFGICPHVSKMAMVWYVGSLKIAWYRALHATDKIHA